MIEANQYTQRSLRSFLALALTIVLSTGCPISMSDYCLQTATWRDFAYLVVEPRRGRPLPHRVTGTWRRFASSGASIISTPDAKLADSDMSRTPVVFGFIKSISSTESRFAEWRRCRLTRSFVRDIQPWQLWKTLIWCRTPGLGLRYSILAAAMMVAFLMRD